MEVVSLLWRYKAYTLKWIEEYNPKNTLRHSPNARKMDRY